VNSKRKQGLHACHRLFDKFSSDTSSVGTLMMKSLFLCNPSPGISVAPSGRRSSQAPKGRQKIAWHFSARFRGGHSHCLGCSRRTNHSLTRGRRVTANMPLGAQRSNPCFAEYVNRLNLASLSLSRRLLRARPLAVTGQRPQVSKCLPPI